MKYWTIQTKSVMKMIEEDGIYQPDFNRSRYLNNNAKLKDLYYIILNSFNRINKTNLPGVVFSFAKRENDRIYSIKTIEEFEDFIKTKREVINSFWEEIDKENSVIIELDYADDFNPIFIDINDFQFLMPPFCVLPPYSIESFDRILTDIQHGNITFSEFPSYVIQAHLPYIGKQNVVMTYPVFRLD